MKLTYPEAIFCLMAVACLTGSCADAKLPQAKKLPPATEAQAAKAASECGLKKWEWSTGFFVFDGEPDYPGQPAIAFDLDATGLDSAGLSKVLAHVDDVESCLKKNLAAQGVGTNVVGGASQTTQVGGK
ncbi:MAG: hypothetical protein ACXWJC_12195 [Croceibacterium sp.]